MFRKLDAHQQTRNESAGIIRRPPKKGEADSASPFRLWSSCYRKPLSKKRGAGWAYLKLSSRTKLPFRTFDLRLCPRSGPRCVREKCLACATCLVARWRGLLLWQFGFGALFPWSPLKPGYSSQHPRCRTGSPSALPQGRGSDLVNHPELRILQDWDLSIVVESAVWAAVLVHEAPCRSNLGAVAWHSVSLDESRGYNFDSQLAIRNGCIAFCRKQ